MIPEPRIHRSLDLMVPEEEGDYLSFVLGRVGGYLSVCEGVLNEAQVAADDAGDQEMVKSVRLLRKGLSDATELVDIVVDGIHEFFEGPPEPDPEEPF